MFELIKLDEFFKLILCCPICKGKLKISQDGCCCEDCEMFYPAIGKSYDFSIRRPEYCLSSQFKTWKKIQDGFESLSFRSQNQNELSYYLDQIDSVKEIYQEKFNISGTILDVGGEQGRLKHFLDLQNPKNQYCCIDPFLKIIQQETEIQSDFISAYPCLKDPVNFVCGIAERLPFQSKTFDYVHMRSVLDHFSDPYIAIKESYRILKPEGKLLIGLSVTGGKSSLKNISKLSRLHKKLRDQGLWKTTKRVIHESLKVFSEQKGENDHMFHWQYDDLVDMVKSAGLSIEKIHWQKPPYDHCVYLCCKR